MKWSEVYSPVRQPDMKEIGTFVNSTGWGALCKYIETTYKVSPRIEYSQCSMQAGWNVKYKKSSRSVCTLYPEDGYFICLVSIGAKEAREAELILKNCTSYTQELYAVTVPFNGSRWLMIEVTDEHILEDVKELIGVRMKRRK